MNNSTQEITPSQHNVLLIDDDQLVPMMLGNTVRESGFGVQSLTDASKLTMAQIKESDLMILDLMMPDTDGIDIITRLGKTNYTGALILISGLGAECLDEAAKMAGSFKLNVIGVLEKPVHTDQLKKLLVQQAYSLFREDHQPGRATTITPTELTSAVNNDAIDIQVRMTVKVSDSTAIGGEILATCVHESEYLDHDALCEAAALDQLPHNAFTYFMLQHANRYLSKNTDIGMEVSIRLPGRGLIKAMRDPNFVAMLKRASEQSGRLFISFAAEEVARLGEALLARCVRLNSMNIQTALDIQGPRITQYLDQVNRPFNRIVLSNPGILKTQYESGLKKFIDFAHSKGLETALSGVDTLDVLERAKATGFDIVRPLTLR